MTTRADLEREREALIALRESAHVHCMDEFVAPLTASIARLDALLSLSDEQARDVAVMLRGLVLDLPTGWAHVDEGAVDADALRTVADLVRRTS